MKTVDKPGSTRHKPGMDKDKQNPSKRDIESAFIVMASIFGACVVLVIALLTQ